LKRKKTNKVICVVCALLLIWTPTALADEPTPEPTVATTSLSAGKISQLSKGQRAPFAGVLLSNDAAARLYSDIKFSEDECRLRLNKELQTLSIKLNAEIQALTLRLDVETKRTESLVRIKSERIEFLEKNFTPSPWYESGEFWFAMGVVGGILITVGAGYAIGQAGK
jgi:hypothetical protein